MKRLNLRSTFCVFALWVAPQAVQAAILEPASEEEIIEESDEETIVEEEAGESPSAETTPAPPAGGEECLFGDCPEVGKETSEAQAPAASGQAGDKGDADSAEKQLKTDKSFISVVQRQRFLKKKRFDLQPQVGISVNDPFVRHYVVGAEFNYWITNRMAVGLTGSAFFGSKTSRYRNVRFQEGVLLTANRTLWQASANFLYNPFYGKIAVFNRALMHWEAYVQVGGGAIQTEIIPRYEAIHEPFRTVTGQGNFAFGVRFYVPKIDWLSINLGVRTWVFPDKLEPSDRGPSTGPGGLGDNPSLDDPQAAKAAAETTVAFNSVVFFGVSFYLPTTFEYTTRR